MARNNDTREIALNFQTNATEAKSEIDSLLKTLDSTSEEYKELSKLSEDLADATDDLSKSLNKLEDVSIDSNEALEELNNNLSDSTDKMNKVLDRTNKLTSEVKNSNASFKDLGKTLINNSTVTSILDKVTGGYYSTVKDTITSVYDFIKSSNLGAVAQRLFGGATTASSIALNVFKAALITTGIGALVVALGYAAQAMIKFTESTKESSEALNDVADDLDALSSRYTSLADDLSYNYNLSIEKAKQTGATESELAKLRTKHSNDRIKQLEIQLLLLDRVRAYSGGANLSEIAKEQEKLKNQILSIQREETLTQERDKTAAMARSKTATKDHNKVLVDYEKKRVEDTQRMWELHTGFETDNIDKFRKSINRIMQEHTEEFHKNAFLIKEEDRKAANDLVDDYYENLVEKQYSLLKLYKEFDALSKSGSLTTMADMFVNNSIADGRLDEGFEAFVEKFRELGTVIPDVGTALSTFENNIKTRFTRSTDILGQFKSYSESTNREMVDDVFTTNTDILALQESKAIRELELLKATEAEKEDVIKYYNERREDEARRSADAIDRIKQLEFESHLATADGISGILSGLSDASKEGTGIQKGLAIASVAIDSGAAAISAYKGMVKTFPGPWGIAAGTAAAASSVLQGLNQIKRIKQVRTDGSGGGVSGGSISAGATPNVSFVSSSENQIADSIAKSTNAANTTPIKAYVVSSDVTSAQSLDRNAIESSSL